MLSLDEMWAQRTGMKEVPPDVRGEWERRVAPLLESPSGRWQARIEASEMINEWLLAMIYRQTGRLRGGNAADLQGLEERMDAALGKVLEAVKGDESGKALEAQDRLIGKADRIGALLLGVDEKIGEIGGKADAALEALAAISRAVLESRAALEGLAEARKSGPDETDGETKGFMERLRGKWREIAICGLVGVILVIGSYFAGWQSRKALYEHYWVEIPAKQAKPAWDPALEWK